MESKDDTEMTAEEFWSDLAEGRPADVVTSRAELLRLAQGPAGLPIWLSFGSSGAMSPQQLTYHLSSPPVFGDPRGVAALPGAGDPVGAP